MAANKSKDFWKDMCIHSISKNPTSSYINDLCNDKDIASLFADRFAKTLNVCASDDWVSYTSPDCSLGDMLQHSISPEYVSEAFKHLERNKCDGSELDSNHLIFASEAISESFSHLFTAMLRHGLFLASIRDCTLVPIPKRGKDIAQSESYRLLLLLRIYISANCLNSAYSCSSHSTFVLQICSLASKVVCPLPTILVPSRTLWLDT